MNDYGDWDDNDPIDNSSDYSDPLYEEALKPKGKPIEYAKERDNFGQIVIAVVIIIWILLGSAISI
jgi:hypothetical protein